MIVLYRLRNTREGRKRDEFPAGSLDFRDGQLALDVPDKALARSIQQLFAEEFQVRSVRGSTDTFLGHTWLTLRPGSEQHFDEGLRRLVRLDLAGDF